MKKLVINDVPYFRLMDIFTLDGHTRKCHRPGDVLRLNKFLELYYEGHILAIEDKGKKYLYGTTKAVNVYRTVLNNRTKK